MGYFHMSQVDSITQRNTSYVIFFLVKFAIAECSILGCTKM